MDAQEKPVDTFPPMPDPAARLAAMERSVAVGFALTALCSLVVHYVRREDRRNGRG